MLWHALLCALHGGKDAGFSAESLAGEVRRSLPRVWELVTNVALLPKQHSDTVLPNEMSALRGQM